MTALADGRSPASSIAVTFCTHGVKRIAELAAQVPFHRLRLDEFTLGDRTRAGRGLRDMNQPPEEVHIANGLDTLWHGGRRLVRPLRRRRVDAEADTFRVCGESGECLADGQRGFTRHPQPLGDDRSPEGEDRRAVDSKCQGRLHQQAIASGSEHTRRSEYHPLDGIPHQYDGNRIAKESAASRTPLPDCPGI